MGNHGQAFKRQSEWSPQKKNTGKSGATTVSLEVSRSWIRKNHDIAALVSAPEMSLVLQGMALKDLGLFAILTVEHIQQIFAATPYAKIPGGRIGAFHTQVWRSVDPGLAKVLQCISGFKSYQIINLQVCGHISPN